MIDLAVLWAVADSIANCRYVSDCEKCNEIHKLHELNHLHISTCPFICPGKEIEETMKHIASMAKTCIDLKVNKISEEYFLDLLKEEGEACSK